MDFASRTPRVMRPQGINGGDLVSSTSSKVGPQLRNQTVREMLEENLTHPGQQLKSHGEF